MMSEIYVACSLEPSLVNDDRAMGKVVEMCEWELTRSNGVVADARWDIWYVEEWFNKESGEIEPERFDIIVMAPVRTGA